MSDIHGQQENNKNASLILYGAVFNEHDSNAIPSKWIADTRESEADQSQTHLTDA